MRRSATGVKTYVLPSDMQLHFTSRISQPDNNATIVWKVCKSRHAAVQAQSNNHSCTDIIFSRCDYLCVDHLSHPLTSDSLAGFVSRQVLGGPGPTLVLGGPGPMLGARRPRADAAFTVPAQLACSSDPPNFSSNCRLENWSGGCTG